MKKLFVLLIVASSILVTSCKKDNEAIPEKNEVKTSETLRKEKSVLGNWD